MGVYIKELRLSNGLVLYSDSRTAVYQLFKEIYRNKVYTPDDFPGIEENDVIVDLGANIGVFAVYAASISPTIRVHAFEPASQSFALLQQNVQVNNLLNIHCHRCCVSSMTGKNTLYVTQKRSAGDTIVSSRIPAEGILAAESVDCLSLKDLFVRCNVSTCNFLKVDVEGSEFDIFSTASFETLGRIEKIAMEYHEGECRKGIQLAELLESAQFQVKMNPVKMIPEPRWPRGMIYAHR